VAGLYAYYISVKASLPNFWLEKCYLPVKIG
jgi:hypothetical protein